MKLPLIFKFCFGLAITAVLFVSTNANVRADIVVNFNNDIGGGASLADFTSADPLLDSTATFAFGNNAGGFSNFSQTVDGLTFTTTGAPQNDGFAANAPINQSNPILASNIFDVGAPLGISVSGLSSLSAGDIVTVVGYGVGDGANQDVVFDANFTGPAQSAATSFGDGTVAGSVPFQVFTFTADGVTDALTLVSTGNPSNAGQDGPARSHISGFSLSVTAPAAIPEPSGLMFVGSLMLVGAIRRKRS